MKIMLPEQLIAPPLLPPEQFCRPFSLAEILSATNNFDESLVVGHGGFGKVYHGVIDNGANTVAIKRLNSTSKQGDSEFRAEIELLSKFRHTHIVSLIGYCSNSSEMILVYDYMVNGSLADHLYKIGRHGNGSTLSWVQRLKICLGAARGLDYLHTGTTVQGSVIHRDVKSSNILLNKNWAAKVSDFGLSRISPNNQSDTHISTNVKGTVGYMDPEYLLTLRLTMKSDVYSFGIVLFEVMCGRRAVDLRLDEEQWSLARWVSCCIKEGTLHQVIDPKLKWEILPNSLTEFVRIADQCLCYRSKKRPTMTQVVASLEFALALQLGTGSSSTFEMDIFSTSEASDNLKRVDSEIGQQKVINFGNSDEHINDEQKEEIVFYAQEVDSEIGQQEAIKFGKSDERNEEIVSSAQEVDSDIGQQEVIKFGNSDEQNEETVFSAQDFDSEIGQQDLIKFGNSDEPNEEIVSSAQEVSGYDGNVSMVLRHAQPGSGIRNWVEGYMGQIGSVLRRGGWGKSDVAEIVQMSPSCLFESDNKVSPDNQAILDALLVKLDCYADLLRKGGWSSDEVSDALRF